MERDGNLETDFFDEEGHPIVFFDDLRNAVSWFFQSRCRWNEDKEKLFLFVRFRDGLYFYVCFGRVENEGIEKNRIGSYDGKLMIIIAFLDLV